MDETDPYIADGVHPVCCDLFMIPITTLYAWTCTECQTICMVTPARERF